MLSIILGCNSTKSKIDVYSRKISRIFKAQGAYSQVHATRHMPHATRRTPLATRHTSHVTRHTPHATRHTPHATRRPTPYRNTITAPYHLVLRYLQKFRDAEARVTAIDQSSYTCEMYDTKFNSIHHFSFNLTLIQAKQVSFFCSC